MKIDLNKTPFINITWKIESDLRGIKENTKKDMILQQEYLQLKKQAQHLFQIEQLTMCSQVTRKLASIHLVLTQKSIDNVLSTTINNFDKWVTVKANVKRILKSFII